MPVCRPVRNSPPNGGKDSLSFDSGYYLLPVLRPEAVDLERDDATGFPAVQRVALHSNLCALFAAW